jgi:hypothetical protein
MNWTVITPYSHFVGSTILALIINTGVLDVMLVVLLTFELQR